MSLEPPDAAVELVVAPRIRAVGRGEVRRLLPFRTRRAVGPFVFADLMGPENLGPGHGVDVDAHPHIGLSTLTYLFDGAMVHRDSTGAHQRIEPGAVNWMTAGRGACHTERSPDDERAVGSSLAGLQTWVALPDDLEECDPFFEHHPAGSLPEERRAGLTVRLAAGTGFGLTSPVGASSPLMLAELRLSATRTEIPTEHPERAVLAVSGELDLDGLTLPEAHLAVLAPGSRPRLGGTGHAVVLGGESVGPRHIWWNFVSSRAERIETAKRDWTAQRFPLVAGDHDPWVPLPG